MGRKGGWRNCLTDVEIWHAACALPDGVEADLLHGLMKPHYEATDAACERLLAIPAQTDEGRAAQVLMLISHIMPNEWRMPDDAVDHEVKKCRDLLFTLVGSKTGADLRDQFSA